MGPDLLPVDAEHHVLAGLVPHQPPEELSVGLAPLGLGHGGQHLVVKQQLPDGVSQKAKRVGRPRQKDVSLNHHNKRIQQRRFDVKDCEIILEALKQGKPSIHDIVQAEYELKIAQDDLDLAVLDRANAVAEGLTIISDEDEDSLMGVLDRKMFL